MRAKAKEKALVFSDETVKAAIHELSAQRSGKDFGNAGAVINLFGEAQIRQAARLGASGNEEHSKKALVELPASNFQTARPDFESVTTDLEKYAGLHQVKAELAELRALLQAAKRRGTDVRDSFEPYDVMEGNQGVGNNAIAHEMAKLFHATGALQSSDVVTISMNDLIGQWLGQTSSKTQLTLEKGLRKTILIENAGRLAQLQNSYAREATDSLIEFMAKNRGKVSIIFSDTDVGMKSLLTAYPRLAQAINRHLLFEDLSLPESMELLEKELAERKQTLTAEAKQKLPVLLERLRTAPGSANGDDLHLFRKKILAKQAARLADATDEHASDRVELADFMGALDVLLRAKVETKVAVAQAPLPASVAPPPLQASQEETKAEVAKPVVAPAKVNKTKVAAANDVEFESPLSPGSKEVANILEKLADEELLMPKCSVTPQRVETLPTSCFRR